MLRAATRAGRRPCRGSSARRRARRGSRRASRGSRPRPPRRARGPVYVPSPPGMARTSAVRAAVRPDRKFVTGTIATSDSTSAAGAADADGRLGRGRLAGRRFAGPATRSGRPAWRSSPRRPGRASVTQPAPAEATEHDAAEPDAHAEDERDDDRGDEPRRASRGGLRRPRVVGGIADGHARQGSGRGRLPPSAGIGTPRPGGRTGREKNRKVMADPTGFEPAISSVTGWHVGPLHHGSSAGGGS